MGTSVRIVLYAPSAGEAESAARAAFQEIADVDAAMSDYRAESELSRLSRSAGQGDRLVSEPLFEVLEAAQRYARLSEGSFDATVGPLVRLWRQARTARRLPDPAVIRDTLGRVGYAHLVLDAARRTARLEKPGMRLDLGGIAKGYACDRALARLRRMSIPIALVDAGGGMALGEPPPERPGWRIQIAGEADRILLLSGCGVATSGDTERFVEIDGARYSHIVDPRTGLGLTNRALVTVVAPDGMSADALSTAVSVMGPERGLRLAEELSGTEARYRWEEGGSVRSDETSGFPRLLDPKGMP